MSAATPSRPARATMTMLRLLRRVFCLSPYLLLLLLLLLLLTGLFSRRKVKAAQKEKN